MYVTICFFKSNYRGSHIPSLCMLGVFLLPEFTCLGHECPDPWSPCDGMYVYYID